MIGISFPVKGSKPPKVVAWGFVEVHRAEIEKKFKARLERLAGSGGLTAEELKEFIGEEPLK